MRIKFAVTLGVTFAVFSTVVSPAEVSPQRLARDILTNTRVKGGLVIHLGCGDGRLTAALRAGDGYLVQGLDRDASNVARAREYVQRIGVANDVQIDLWRGSRLPFVDNLVNLFVAQALGNVPMAEVTRVLAPQGVAYVKRGERWQRFVKPWPKEIDEWTHYLHEPGGNAVAHDGRVGPPRHMQWLARPLWSRHHHSLASISALVSARGRIFYVADEATPASMQVPARWALIARDGFSGVLLWKRTISSWAWYRRKFRSGPVQLPRTLVAVGDRVYIPLGLDAPVTALDAATGKVLISYADTERAEEIVCSKNTLLVVTGWPMAEQAVKVVARKRRRGEKRPRAAPLANKKTVHAFEASTGRMLWKYTPGNLIPLTLAATGERVFFVDGSRVACLDLRLGKKLWETPTARKSRRSAGWSVFTLVAHDGVVLLADGKRLSALSAQHGTKLWECP